MNQFPSHESANKQRDVAVARLLGLFDDPYAHECNGVVRVVDPITREYRSFRPTTVWADCGPILEANNINLRAPSAFAKEWQATYHNGSVFAYGEADCPTEAVCKCYLAIRRKT